MVEPRTEVHLGEHARTSHGVHALINAQNGVHDFLCEGIEAAAVDVEAEASIVLFREEYAGSKRGVGWLDPAVARVLVQLGLEGSGFIR